MKNNVNLNRKRNMQRIHSNDTSIELLLRKKLWAKGYRYRKNFKGLPGKPDIVFPQYNLVVFCDSEFFHGKRWPELKERLSKGNNNSYWVPKIERNMARDIKVTVELQKMGWFVLRLWGDEIKKDPDKCIDIIENAIREING